MNYLIEYKPNWAVKEPGAKDMIFININGKLVTGEAGKPLPPDQANELDPDELEAVNSYLFSKLRLKIKSTISGTPKCIKCGALLNIRNGLCYGCRCLENKY